MSGPDTVYFSPFHLDGRSGQLWCGEEERVLRPKTLAVLHYLVHHAGQVVSKDELLAAVWPEVTVSEAVLTVCINELRRALADDPQRPRFIATVHRHGYRFLPTVTPQPVASSQYPGASRAEETRGWRLETNLPFPQASGLQPQASIVVGREAELAQLRQWWELALGGRRQVVFIAGEPGIGKTTLIDRFLARITSGHAHEFWIGWGQCVEQYGEGEAYLPVLEALARLCRGPEGQQVREVLHRYAPTWLLQMPGLAETAELNALQARTAGATRERMLREMAEALEALTIARGLVLVCEDLHVSDRSTLDLIAYLARRRGPARLLILGSYRPAEVIVRAHPLREMVQELQSHQQCQHLPVELLSGRAVGEYLTLWFAPQPVPPAFITQVYERTEGKALFLVTLVDYLLRQGSLRQEQEEWQWPDSLQGIGVPESVRQLIERQVEHLSEDEQRVLEVASVAGMEFSAAAVSAGLEMELLRSEERCEAIARRTPFLQPSGMEEWPDGTGGTRYRFRHAVHQEVVYDRLSASRQRALHQRLGERLEVAYGQQAGEIAAALAVHFERGRDYQRAVQYHHLAAQRALGQHAPRETLTHVTRGLSLLPHVPTSSARIQLELALQMTYGVTLAMTQGYAAPEVAHAHLRAHELCHQVTDLLSLSPTLCGLWGFFVARGDFGRATALADQLVTLADHHPETASPALAYGIQGQTRLFLGELTAARAHSVQSLAHYTADQHGHLLSQYNEDPGVISHTLVARTLWLLGYADQAQGQLAAGESLARELGHPYSLAQHLYGAMVLHWWCGQIHQILTCYDALREVCRDEAFPWWLAGGAVVQGWAWVHQGQPDAGLALIHQGVNDWRVSGVNLILPYFLAVLAEAYGRAGRPEEGARVLHEALTVVEATGERWYEAELWRLKGTLVLQSAVRSQNKSRASLRQVKTSPKSPPPNPQSLIPNPQTEAEACFHKAIEIARQQQAKSLELRAVMSLARLWQQRGKLHEAHKMLADIYGWFTEGFDTVDLREAKMLLEELSRDRSHGR